MALVAKTLTLDITPGAIPKVVNVSEYDQNREYTVTLIDDGGTFTIPSGTTATIEGTIGGNAFSEAATVSGNTITFTLSESMTALAGDVWCKIKLTKDSKPIQTCAFILRVDKAGVEAKTIINAPGFLALLQSAVDKWMESQDGIGEAVQEATEAYAQAHGLTPGVATVNGRGGDVTITAEELGAVTDVSGKADKTEVDLALARKQNALTAGENITIEDDTISAEVDADTIAADVTSWLAANVNPTGSAVVVDSSLTVSGAAADAKVTGDFKNSLNIVNPDAYPGGDANKINKCILDLVSSGTGGTIYIGRKYTLNDDVICKLPTDSSSAHTDKVFITFIGIGRDAGFEFGSSGVSFEGDDSGSPYGGFRFININFYQHEAGIGYGSAFTQMSGNIRSVFFNCRFNGFSRVFDGAAAGNASRKIIQNITCIACYFSNCSDYVIDAYSLGDDRKAAYLYGVNIIACIVEKCKGLVKGSAVSGYSVWTNVNIDYNTIENCTGIPIVLGEGVRGVSVAKNYFEKNDYNDTHANIDMRGLYGGDTENKASVYGLNISDNSFIKGVSTGSYEAHSVGILLPTQEPWSESDSADLVHGVIARNVFEDVAFGIDGSPDNPLRFKVEDNSYDAAVDKTVFHDYASSRLPALPSVDGSYTLAVTITNGVPTFTWE